MNKTITRTKGDQWCKAEIKYEKGRLSICGSAGTIYTPKQAKRAALEYWESFFDEDRTQLHEMNDRLGTNYRSARQAAKFVLNTDGEYHGLDIDGEDNKGRLLLVESCGQIVDELKAWFPELIPALPYHLNDMHAECEHQEARAETYSTHPGAECPECGYKLGHGWTYRVVPQNIITALERLGG